MFCSFSNPLSLWLSKIELPLTFADSSVKVIIELLPAVMRQEIGKWHMGLVRKKKKEKKKKRTNEQKKEGKKKRKKEKRTKQEQKISTRTNITQYALQVNLFSESFSLSNHSSLSSLPKCKRLIPSVWGKFSLSKIFGTYNSRICPVQCLQKRAIKLDLVNTVPIPNLPF